MATGMPPWGELQPIAAIYAIGSGETPPPQLPLEFSSEARDFVNKCLIRNPDERPSAADLLEHDFLKNNLA
jgi:serine/threonine kinase 3